MKSFIIAIAAAMPLYAQEAPAPAPEAQNPAPQDSACPCSCPGGRQAHRGHHRHHHNSPFAGEARKLVIAKYDKDGDGRLNDEEKAALQADAKAMMEQKKAEFMAQFDKDGDGKLSDDEKAAMKADFQAKRDRRRAEFAQKHPEMAAKMERKKAEFMAKFDKDGDGKLSDDEKAAAKADMKGKCGSCDRPEGKRGPKGPHARHSMHRGMFAGMIVGRALMLEKYDADKDGKLSPEELGDLAPKKHGRRPGPCPKSDAPAPAPVPQQ